MVQMAYRDGVGPTRRLLRRHDDAEMPTGAEYARPPHGGLARAFDGQPKSSRVDGGGKWGGIFSSGKGRGRDRGGRGHANGRREGLWEGGGKPEAGRQIMRLRSAAASGRSRLRLAFTGGEVGLRGKGRLSTFEGTILRHQETRGRFWRSAPANPRENLEHVPFQLPTPNLAANSPFQGRRCLPIDSPGPLGGLRGFH
jgi:hypothetical protein